jgi:hypothetical protein
MANAGDFTQARTDGPVPAASVEDYVPDSCESDSRIRPGS